MSYYTEVLVSCDEEFDHICEAVCILNARLGAMPSFVRLSEHLELYHASFNHLDLPALLEKIKALPWATPLAVQVLAKGEGDFHFKEVLFGGYETNNSGFGTRFVWWGECDERD